MFFSLSLGCLVLDLPKLLFMTNDVCFFRSASLDVISLSSFFTALEAAFCCFLCCRLSSLCCFLCSRLSSLCSRLSSLCCFLSSRLSSLCCFLCCRLSFLDLGGCFARDEACFLLGDITDLSFVSFFSIAFVERAKFSVLFCLFFSSLDGCFLHGLDWVLFKVSEDLFLRLGI